MKFALGFVTGVGTTIGAIYIVAGNLDVLDAVVRSVDDVLEERKKSDSTSKVVPPTAEEAYVGGEASPQSEEESGH